jgi:DNA-binding IclR family transcriptional regulator/nitroimidazol reductase NimA-like FMN-containing flavoprotein (pyridoxamine 5'-phosphate oxidase superfamily)
MPNPAVERTLLILEAVMKNPQGIYPQQLQKSLGISRSTLYGILRSLKELGYLEQTGGRGPYRSGPRLVAWERRAPLRPLNLMSAFYSEAAALQLDETLALLLPVADGLLVLAQVEAPALIRSAYQTGQVYADQRTAAGDLFTHPLPENIRLQGYAQQDTPELSELALPVCADGYVPEAALLVSAPAFRKKPADLLKQLPALREAAARLSYRLGAQVYAPYQAEIPPTIEPAQIMEQDEISSFLKGPWAARLACLRPDGTPHVVPVWHEWNGVSFHVVAWQGSRWGEYLQADPHLSLSVDEPWPPLRRVSVQGQAQLLNPVESQALLPALLERLSRRYLGQAVLPGLEQRPGSLFRILPEKIRGWRGLHPAQAGAR